MTGKSTRQTLLISQSGNQTRGRSEQLTLALDVVKCAAEKAVALALAAPDFPQCGAINSSLEILGRFSPRRMDAFDPTQPSA